MLRISLLYVAEFSEVLLQAQPVTPQTKLVDVIFSIFNLQTKLQGLLYQSVYSPSLRVCRLPGMKLIEACDRFDKLESLESAIDPYLASQYNSALETFRTTFKAELETFSSYFVTSKRGYDVVSLIETAVVIFPPDLLEKVPAVEFDIKEAGRCIAFELPTAAGFHLLRALETIIATYWSNVMSGQPLPKERNLGSYITKMADANVAGTEKVLAALKQIKDLHRNPLMHPEDTLNLDECIGLLNIVQSAIVPMLARIPSVRKTASLP